MSHQAWEYRVVYLRPVDEGGTLTHLGAEGWELVAVLDVPAPYCAKAYLKRLSAARPAEERGMAVPRHGGRVMMSRKQRRQHHERHAQ